MASLIHKADWTFNWHLQETFKKEVPENVLEVFRAEIEEQIIIRGEVKQEELVITKPQVKLKRPPFYKVLMLNDDYTPMDFVVSILKEVFHQSHEKAVDVMLQIHHQGFGICGIFTKDVAETKISIVTDCARKNEFPLRCVMEEE